MSRVKVRAAADADLIALNVIEDEADQLFASVISIEAWQPAPRGGERAGQPGFILVASIDNDSEVIGFVHVLSVQDDGHLEQLSVRPSAAGQGHGRALVEAAIREAAHRGYKRLTLRTFADIPWNAPFYERCGFHASEPDNDFLENLVNVEATLGLPAQGRRIQMEFGLTRFIDR